MRELPIYKVTIHIAGCGDWGRVFPGRPTMDEILGTLIEDQKSLVSGHALRWEQYDHWLTLIRDYKLPATDTVNKVCLYVGKPVGVIKIDRLLPAVVTEGIE